MPLVELAEQRRVLQSKGESYMDILPAIQPHKQIILRIMYVYIDDRLVRVERRIMDFLDKFKGEGRVKNFIPSNFKTSIQSCTK